MANIVVNNNIVNIVRRERTRRVVGIKPLVEKDVVQEDGVKWRGGCARVAGSAMGSAKENDDLAGVGEMFEMTKPNSVERERGEEE